MLTTTAPFRDHTADWSTNRTRRRDHTGDWTAKTIQYCDQTAK
jgi:hypothetical protein